MDMANTLSRTCKASRLAAVTSQDSSSPPPFLGGVTVGLVGSPPPLFWVTGQFQSGQLVQVLHCEEQSTVIGLINLHSIPQNLNSWLSTLVSIANVVNEVWPWLCLTIALQPYVLLV